MAYSVSYIPINRLVCVLSHNFIVSSTEKERDLHAIGTRLYQERTARFPSHASFAEAYGDLNPQTVGRWERGQNEPGALALQRMNRLGLDVLYIVTGGRSGTHVVLHDDEEAVLSARGIYCRTGPHRDEIHITLQGLCWLLNYHAQLLPEQDLAWGGALLRAVGAYSGQLSDLNVQCVALEPEAGMRYEQLIFYIARTPPAVPYATLPPSRLTSRYALDVDTSTLPIRFADADYIAPVLVLNPEQLEAVRSGQIYRVHPHAGGMR